MPKKNALRATAASSRTHSNRIQSPQLDAPQALSQYVEYELTLAERNAA